MIQTTLSDRIKETIRDIPDFPKKGIIFKDITPVLANNELFTESVKAMVQPFQSSGVQAIIGIESRGFIFGSVAAKELGCGFIPVRKKGKLPAETYEISYALEYGESTLEIHTDAIKKGARVLIMDDLLATGGTAKAVAELVKKVKGEVVGISFLVELTFLKGRDILKDYPVHSVITY